MSSTIGYVGRRPQPAAHLEAVDARHHHVEHDQVGRLVAHGGQGARPVGRLADLVAGVAEVVDDDLAHGGVVVDDQHLRHRDSLLARVTGGTRTNPATATSTTTMALIAHHVAR